MARLVLAVLIVALVLRPAAAQVPRLVQCDHVERCLQEGASDCTAPDTSCAGGLFCSVSTTATPDPVTSRYPSSCKRAARVGERCSSFSPVLPCYSPEGYSVLCFDPLLDGNGTCVYDSLFTPGSSCVENNANYSYGGCISDACTSGKCPVLTENATCAGVVVDYLQCGPTLFCNQSGIVGSTRVIPSLKCEPRLPLNASCTLGLNYQCQPGLVCGAYARCVEMFKTGEGELCDSSAECAAGLFCTVATFGGADLVRSCQRPSTSFGGDCAMIGSGLRPSGSSSGVVRDVLPAQLVEERADQICNSGWLCECSVEVSNGLVTQTGGKCSVSIANTAVLINAVRSLDQCLRSSIGYDVNWFVHWHLFALGPNTPLSNCLAQAGVSVDDVYQLYEAGSILIARDDVSKSREERMQFVAGGFLPEGQCVLSLPPALSPSTTADAASAALVAHMAVMLCALLGLVLVL